MFLCVGHELVPALEGRLCGSVPVDLLYVTEKKSTGLGIHKINIKYKKNSLKKMLERLFQSSRLMFQRRSLIIT